MGSIFWIAIIVFVVSYAIIISEKIHRTVIALSGASLLMLLGVINQEQAIEGIDFNTLGLLIGMMIIVTIAKESGMFQFVALWAAKISKGSPMKLFVFLGIITAIFSALLDNVTTVLLMVPVTFVLANNLKINPKPFLFNLILLANIGGTATLIGDPPNILIGSAQGLSFTDFLVHLGPISLILILVTSGTLAMYYRKSLVADKQTMAHVASLDPKSSISNYHLLYKSIFVISVVLLGFFTHSVTHLEGATIALAGAALLLLITLNEPEHSLSEVEWTTIFFFVGLFVLVTGLEHVGAIEMLAKIMIDVTHGEPSLTMFGLLWASGIFSSLIDNIPFVATMIPLIQNIGNISGIDTAPLWWILAMGADIGGNGTLIGASANLVVAGMAEKNGYKIGFLEYMKVAMPMTILALSICSLYVYIRYV